METWRAYRPRLVLDPWRPRASCNGRAGMRGRGVRVQRAVGRLVGVSAVPMLREHAVALPTTKSCWTAGRGAAAGDGPGQLSTRSRQREHDDRAICRPYARHWLVERARHPVGATMASRPRAACDEAVRPGRFRRSTICVAGQQVHDRRDRSRHAPGAPPLSGRRLRDRFRLSRTQRSLSNSACWSSPNIERSALSEPPLYLRLRHGAPTVTCRVISATTASPTPLSIGRQGPSGAAPLQAHHPATVDEDRLTVDPVAGLRTQQQQGADEILGGPRLLARECRLRGRCARASPWPG